MQITLVQGILLALACIVIGVDYWLEAFFIFRPIIVASITGLILGDLKLGLVAGGLTELAFAGLTPAGGTQPPNPILAGVMTVVIAHTTNTSPALAIGLALPFSILMQYVILFFYSSFSMFMAKADHYAENADVKALTQLNYLTTAIVAVSYGVIVFLSAYAAQDLLKSLIDILPVWFIHGLEIAGGILPAVGFAMLLNVMLKLQYIPFFIVGFFLITYLPITNLLPVAVVGLGLGMYDYFFVKSDDDKAKGGVQNDGI